MVHWTELVRPCSDQQQPSSKTPWGVLLVRAGCPCEKMKYEAGSLVWRLIKHQDMTQQFMLLTQHRSPDQPMRKHVQCEHSQLISLPFSPALCDTPNIFGVSCFSEWTEPLTQTLDWTPQLTLLTLLTLLIFFKGYFNYKSNKHNRINTCTCLRPLKITFRSLGHDFKWLRWQHCV